MIVRDVFCPLSLWEREKNPRASPIIFIVTPYWTKAARV